MQHVSPQRMSTKPSLKERDSAPQPTDIAERMIALKRKQARYVRYPMISAPSYPFFFSFIHLSHSPSSCPQPYQSQRPRRAPRCICPAEPPITAPEATATFRTVASKAHNQARARPERVLSRSQAFPHPKTFFTRTRPQTSGQVVQPRHGSDPHASSRRRRARGPVGVPREFLRTPSCSGVIQTSSSRRIATQAAL
jgi:hypothetical protein